MNEKIEVPTMKVPPLKKICMTIGQLPTSYLESMSYYEMLVWFVHYLRDDIIPVVNANGEATRELQELYVELQSYVNNYFDNLDVQEEINNKLDDMLESGQLQEIIYQFLQSNVAWMFDNVASMKASEGLIDQSYAQTLGFNSKNDGGSSLYYVREKTNEDVIDEKSIIAITDTNLIAILINNKGYVVPEQFGAYGDDTHDDSASIQACINYATTNSYTIEFLKKTYKINSTIYLNNNNPNINGNNGTIHSETENAIISMNSGDILRECKIENIKIVGNNNTASTNIGLLCCGYHCLFKNITCSSVAIGMKVDTNNASGNLTGNHYENLQMRDCNKISMIIGNDSNNKLTDGYINNCVFGGNVSDYHLSIGSCGGYKINNLHFWGTCPVALRTRNTGHTFINGLYIEGYTTNALNCHIARDLNISNITANITDSNTYAFNFPQASVTYLKSINMNNITLNCGNSELENIGLFTGDNVSYTPVNISNLQIRSVIDYTYINPNNTRLLLNFNDFKNTINTDIDYTKYPTLYDYALAMSKNSRIMIYGARYNNHFSDIPSMSEGTYTLTILKGDTLGDSTFELFNHSANVKHLYKGYYDTNQMKWIEISYT